MLYTFSPFLLLRMPAGIPNENIENIQQFLNDPDFCAGIMLASPVLFALLQKKQSDASKLTDKEKVTLKKYINRFCYRPTPFGLFASVSLVTWAEQTTPVNKKHFYRWYCRPDMSFNHLLAQSLLPTTSDQSYEINSSIYRVLNEYRFIRTGFDPTGRHREYQLQSIPFSTVIRDLLNFCNVGQKLNAIIKQISVLAGCSLPESMEYANFLVDSQILVNSKRMNIVGREQFEALSEYLSEGDLKQKMRKLSLKLAGLSPVQDIDQTLALMEVQRELTDLLPEHRREQNAQLSVILKREAIEEHISIQKQDDIRHGVHALSLLAGEGEISAMEDFVSGYLKYFEGQSMPLLTAIDPEAGIGYQQPVREKNNPLLETFNIPQKNNGPIYDRWSERHSLLMAAWLRDRSSQPVIRLEIADLEKLKGYGEHRQMLGMSILFRMAGDKVSIENAGGINAPALMGRFTVADESIRQAAVSMAQHIETKNPEIIFAELLHFADPHTDNINTREHVYSFEIPVTAASTLPPDQQIKLSDLYVSVVENKVILFSQKHQKVVVPRLTSAYNHGLNKLPLFRFLTDLSYQYGQYHLGFDLRQFFPGQQFYPRVEYLNTILSPATWVLDGEQINILQKATQGDISSAFKKVSETLKLPRCFLIAEGDQELVFDSEHLSDIKFFCECIQSKKEIVLKEFYKQEDLRQYNCYLLPEEAIHIPKPKFFEISNIKSRRKYLPGSEWLYLKIYAPKIGADRLLLQIRPLITKRYQHGKISKWFFIRYEDHAPHIRLRLKVAPNAISEILLAFKTKLQDRIHQHLIREYQVDVYSRELERYRFAGIEKTECFFWASSELLMRFLQQNRKRPTGGTYAFALCSTFAMIGAYIDDPVAQVHFTLESFQRFAMEFADKPFKVGLDKKYRELTPGIIGALSSCPPDLMSGSNAAGKKFLKCLKDTNVKPGSPESKLEYLRSLIHMHLNRIFSEEGRKQEMIIYYLLHKYMLSVKGRARKTFASEVINGSLLPNALP